jgi:hypothetical protein
MHVARFCALVFIASVAEAQLFTSKFLLCDTMYTKLSYSDNSIPILSSNATTSSVLVNTTAPSLRADGSALTTSANATILRPLANTTGLLSQINATTPGLFRPTNATFFPPNATITRPPLLPTSALYPNVTLNGTTNGTKNACQAEFEVYESLRNGGWERTTEITRTTVFTWYWELTTFSTEIYQCIQTCGSICYAGSVTTMKSTTVLTEAHSQVVTDDPPFPFPMPNCTIPFDECLSIQTSYASAVSSYNSMDLTYQGFNQDPVRPYCSACVSTDCHFNGMFGMSLYFWPTTATTTRDYCTSKPVGDWASDYSPDINHTYVPITTGPYAVVDNITMYQGNVYISFWEPQVYDNCGSSIARRNPGRDKIITVASDALYSIRKYPDALAPYPVKWDLIPWSVNYDDFNEPVPWSAYSGQRLCAQKDTETARLCAIVKPGQYYPHMMMPPQIRGLDPAWATCKYDEYASFDPPIALKPAHDMFSGLPATPTVGGEVRPVITPATPGQPGGGTMPIVTARPGKPETPGEDHVHNQLPPLQQPQDPAPTPTSGGSPNAPVDVPWPEVTIGSSVVPVDPSHGLVVKPGVTLMPGDPAAIVDGTTFSIGTSGVVVADGKSTTTFRIPPVISQQPVITIGSSVLPLDSPGQVIVRPGVTLRRDEPPVTIDGTTMSIGPSGVVMVNSKSTSTMTVPAVNIETPAITIGPSVVPFDASGGLVIRAGQTLRPGDPPVAISGTTYSIGPSGVVVIDNRGTSTLMFPMSKEYIVVGSQTYTLMNGKLTMGAHLTLSGPGGMAIMAGTTVMLKSGSVEIVSGSGTSVIPIKSKLHGKPTETAGVTPSGSGQEAEATGTRISAAFPTTRKSNIVLSILASLLLSYMSANR